MAFSFGKVFPQTTESAVPSLACEIHLISSGTQSLFKAIEEVRGITGCNKIVQIRRTS